MASRGGAPHLHRPLVSAAALSTSVAAPHWPRCRRFPSRQSPRRSPATATAPAASLAAALLQRQRLAGASAAASVGGPASGRQQWQGWRGSAAAGASRGLWAPHGRRLGRRLRLRGAPLGCWPQGAPAAAGPAAAQADGGAGGDAASEIASPAVPWQTAFIPFLFPALGGLLFGFDIGATSGALLSIKDPLLSGTDWPPLSATDTGLLVSASLAGALIGCLAAFQVADPLGRRRELLLSAALFLSGSLLMATAPSFALLLAGKAVYGAGIGLAMHAAPMYIAETSPPAVRGTLIALKEAFIVAGILLGYSAGFLLVGQPAGWRLIFLSAAPVAAAMGAGMAQLPPSPRWLLLRAQAEEEAEAEARVQGEGGSAGRWGAEEDEAEGRDGQGCSSSGSSSPTAFRSLSALALQRQAEEALARLRGEEGAVEGGPASPRVAAEVAEMALCLREETRGQRGGGSRWQELLQGSNGRALTVACGLVLFQQVTGQPSVLYYAGPILQDAGFAAASDASLVAVGLGAFKLLMTGVAVATVDRWGRRPLLLAGVAGLAGSLLLLSALNQPAWAASLGPSAPWLSVSALLLYVGCYQVSFGPIAWLLVAEVFSLRVRGRAQSLATLANFAANAAVTFALPPLQEALAPSGTFALFAALGGAAWLFILLRVPETRGLSLEEIQARLQ